MKKCLNNRAKQENLDLSRFLRIIDESDKKRFQIFSIFFSAPYIYTKKEMSTEWITDFLQESPHGIQPTYTRDLLLVEITLTILF